MEYIGVFHEDGNYKTFYTCFCRVKVNDKEYDCPQCGNRVIDPRERDRFTRGEERKALAGRVLARYMESGRYEAGKVAARLLGEEFFMPHLCLHCGEPEPECDCVGADYK